MTLVFHTSIDSISIYNIDIIINSYAKVIEVKLKDGQDATSEIQKALDEAAKAGMYNMSKRTWLKAGKMMLLYDMKPDDAVQ